MDISVCSCRESYGDYERYDGQERYGDGHGHRYRELTAELSSCLAVQGLETGLQALISKVWKRGSYLLYLTSVPKSYAL